MKLGADGLPATGTRLAGSWVSTSLLQVGTFHHAAASHTYLGWLRGFLLPAPPEQHENKAQSTTGLPQRGTMAGTAVLLLVKPLLQSLLRASSPPASSAQELAGEGIWLCSHGRDVKQGGRA